MIYFCIFIVLSIIAIIMKNIFVYIRYDTYLDHNASVPSDKEISYKEFLKFMKNK